MSGTGDPSSTRTILPIQTPSITILAPKAASMSRVVVRKLVQNEILRWTYLVDG